VHQVQLAHLAVVHSRHDERLGVGRPGDAGADARVAIDAAALSSALSVVLLLRLLLGELLLLALLRRVSRAEAVVLHAVVRQLDRVFARHVDDVEIVITREREAAAVRRIVVEVAAAAPAESTAASATAGTTAAGVAAAGVDRVGRSWRRAARSTAPAPSTAPGRTIVRRSQALERLGRDVPLPFRAVRGEAERLSILRERDRREWQILWIVRVMTQLGELRRQLALIEQRLLRLRRRHDEEEGRAAMVLPVVAE